MKPVIFAGLALAVCNAAWAEVPKPSCINTRYSYVAHPLNSHDIFVQNSLGRPLPPIRLETSCHYLQPTLGFGLSSQFNCIGRGDSVTAMPIGGPRQSCIVTKVLPYEPREGDIKRYAPLNGPDKAYVPVDEPKP